MTLDIVKKTIHDSEAIIKGNESLIGSGVWNIGNELKIIRDTKSYKEKGYDSFEEYANNELNYKKSQCYNFIAINESYSFQSIGKIQKLGMTKLLELTTLEEEKRESFIESNPVEDMTTRELRQAIKEKKALEKELEDTKHKHNNLLAKNLKLENQEPKVIEVPVEKIPDDYEYYKESTEKLQNQVRNLKRNLEDKEINLDHIKNEKSILEKKAKLNDEEAKKYNEMKKQIDFLYKEKSDLSRQIESATELSGLAVKIDHLLKTDLAPIRYSRIFERMDSEVARENLLNILDQVGQWCFDMKNMIPDEYRRVEVYHE